MKVLIIEDGDEYLDNLSRFVAGPTYIQVHSGAAALSRLSQRGPGEAIDLVYLDMRFDRIPEGDLLGDHAAATREHNGDPIRAWRHLANHQGLFILNALKQGGHSDVPVILSYDFSREQPRLRHLQRVHRNLNWVPDAVTPDEIRRLMEHLTGLSSHG
ncbi:MAG: hypothetical protein ACE366_30545 [Bradymonadia bacterium]